jgi:hypothetical protein
MQEERGRARMEARFGPPGTGRRELTIGHTAYGLAAVMARLGLDFQGCRTIDGFDLGSAGFAIRYYDPEEQRIVVYEFDGDFRYLGETRVEAAAWAGEDVLVLGGPVAPPTASRPAGSARAWTSR